MSHAWLSPLLAAIATAALAVLVSRRGSRTELNQGFTFLATTLIFWNLNFFVLYSVANRHLAYEVSRIFRYGIVFLPPALFHLFVTLRKRRSRIWPVVLITDYAFSSALAGLNAFDLLIVTLKKGPWGYISVGGPLYGLFILSTVVNCLAAIALMAYDYRTTTEPRVRLQLRFWIVGTLPGIPLGLTNFLPTYGIPIYPLGSIGSTMWAGIVAYAIVRHRLMDIDIVVTKGMAYAGVSFILIAPTFAFLLWLERVFFGVVQPDFSFALLVMLIAVGVLFPTLRLQTESRIERSIFHEKHEYRTALSAFTRTIVRILDSERLIHELATTLTQTLRLDRLAIALADESTDIFKICSTTGPPPTTAEFPRSHAFITGLARASHAVVRDELETSTQKAERSFMATICRANGWEVCIPLKAGDKLIGFLSLGRKRNLETFSVGDLELLETLGAEAAVALENARLYDELRKSHEIIQRADRLSALGTLAAGIAHEIRNPLVSIQTFFQLAPERLHDEEFLNTFLGMTANEVKRISDLITELLSFARSPTRSLGPLNLNDLVARVITLLDPEARKHKLTLMHVLSPLAPVVSGDPDQIKQVLINLVLNAIQATPPEGTISVLTRAVIHKDAPFGQLEVRDTGAGIPKDRLDHVFDPFFTTKDKGTGLGLAISHQIVTEHGGLLTAESKENAGTSFFVDLPAFAPGVTADETEKKSARLRAADTPRYARAR